MTLPEDWSTLADDWRQGEAGAQAPALPALQARDRAARRQTTWVRAGGLLFSAVIVIGGARILRWHPNVLGVLLVLPAWLLVGVLWRLVILGSAGMEPRGEAATDFIDAAARQVRRRLGTIRTLVILIAVQALVLLLWALARFIERAGRPVPPDAPAWLWLALVAGVAIWWALRYRRRLQAQLNEIDHLAVGVLADEHLDRGARRQRC